MHYTKHGRYQRLGTFLDHREALRKDEGQGSNPWLSLTAWVFLAIGTTIWQLKLQLAFEWSLKSGKGGMIWGNSIETCILPYVKPVQVRLMKQGTQSQCTGTTQRNGMGRAVGGGIGTGGHMYTRGWFMSTYGKNHHNIAKQLAYK